MLKVTATFEQGDWDDDTLGQKMIELGCVDLEIEEVPDPPPHVGGGPKKTKKTDL